MMEATRIIVATVRIRTYLLNLLIVTFDPVWNNFEIGDLDFWRGEAYMKFFEFLDSKGGFYYEVRHNMAILTSWRAI